MQRLNDMKHTQTQANALLDRRSTLTASDPFDGRTQAEHEFAAICHCREMH